MEDFQDIEEGSEPLEETQSDVVQEGVSSKEIDSIAQSVNEIDGKLDVVSDNVDELIALGNRDDAAATDYTAQIDQLHQDLVEVKEIQAFSGLTLVLVAVVLFMIVGVEIGKSVVKWLRFGNG